MGGRIASAATWALVASGAAVGVRASGAPSGDATGRVEGQVTRAGWPERATVEVTRLFDLDAQLDGPGTVRVLDRFLAGGDAWKPVATVATDEQGRYAVDGLPPGVYDAVAMAADGSSDWTGRTVPGPSARVEAHLLLPSATRSLRAEVVHADGRPFRGEVFWTPAWTRQEYENCAHRARKAHREADGTFVLAGLGRDDHDVVAILPGRLRVRAPVPRDGRGLRFVVDDGLVWLRVRVVDDADEKPIADAVLYASGTTRSGGAALVRGVSDAGGRCALRALVGAEAGVSAIRRGYVEAWVDPLTDAGEEVVIRMSRGSTLTGRVLRAEGDVPVAGAVVHAVRPPSRAARWPVGRARTDAEGRYEIVDARPDDVLVFAEAQGLGSERTTVTLGPGRAPPVDLRLTPALPVAGRVRDAEGRPLSGAVVRALANRERRDSKSFAEPPTVLGTAVVRSDGTFALPALPPYPISRLEVRAAGHATFLSEPNPLSAGGGPLDLRLPPVRRTTVLVLDGKTEAPLPGVAVEVLVWTYDSSLEWRGTTGPDGRATSGPVSRGAYRVGAATEGYAVNGTGSATEAEVPSEVTLRLFRGEAISGHVMLPDGAPAADVDVLYTFQLPEGYGAVSKTKTDAAGFFVFHDLPRADGEVWVDTKHGGLAVKGAAPARAGDRDVRVALEAK